MTGINFTIKTSNVIIRNMKLSKVVGGDCLTIQTAKNVWVDHCDLSSDLDHDKDYYDGLVDVTHASEWVAISNTYLHDHVSLLPTQPPHLNTSGFTQPTVESLSCRPLGQQCR